MTSIILAADGRYLPYAICSLAQLARFGRRADGVTVIVPSTASEPTLADLVEAAAAYGIDLNVTRISDLAPLHASGLMSDRSYISHFTYAKLLLAESLPHLDDALYLDIDTLIRAPLDALLSWELRHPIAAVEELGQNSRRLFGTSRDPYFNAGVLRMSLERMRQEEIRQQAQELLLARPALRFMDQDILNLLLRDRLDILPSAYNVFDSLYLANRDLWTMRDPAIVHFAGPLKPWHGTAQSRFAVEWRRLYAEARHSIGNGVAAGPGPPASAPEIASLGHRDGVIGLARRVLPGPVKKAARSAALDALDRTAGRLEQTRTRLELGSQWRSHLAINDPSDDAAVADPDGFAATANCEVDLLIGVPHCGAELLAESLGAAVPGLSYHQGVVGRTLIGPGTSPADASSGDTRRTLVTVFPDQLSPGTFAELLRNVRPRLLMLRREMVFSLAATRSGTENFSESAAADYVLQCDEWFDQAVRLAGKLNLPWLSLTFTGSFIDGYDVPKLASFYPGAAFAVCPESGALRPDSPPGADRTDTSVLKMIESVSSLSTATQINLLRLPGTSFPE